MRALFQRLREKNLTLNVDKCIYNKTSLEFLGYIFGADGIKPSQDKIKTIINLPTPNNVSEVRSLLGMVNFCGAHHISNYAALTHELRQLTKKNVPWSWTDKQNNALTKLKTALSETITLAYFDPKKTTEIYTDASPIGISAVLTQGNRIVQFASRPLNPTEQRYSQTEREALAIIWACEYFHIYIFGAPFIIHTDHKPLTTLLNNPRTQLSARIERWAMRLQPYEMTVQYRPGIDNPADYLSRHPINQTPSGREEKIAEEYINYLVDTAIPKAMTMDEVAMETQKDTTLQAIIKSIQTNQWYMNNTSDSKLFNTLYHCRSELSFNHNLNIILKGRQIILPQSLYAKAIEIAHSGHQGIVKTVALLREKVWIMGMHKLVESCVRNCMLCQIAIPTNNREPLQMSPLPNGPWKELSADFGHLPNGQYILVIMDEYSRYPIVDVLNSLTARNVIPHMDKIFSEFGFPESIKTDNGPPFNSKDFSDFCKHNGINHRKITPMWPRANAEVERFMQTIKKTIRATITPNFKQTMYRFLLDYRTTPHSTTGIPPAMALFGRNLKTKLPHIYENDNKYQAMENRDTQQKQKMKKYADIKNNAKPSTIRVGDPVLIKDTSMKKATHFKPRPLVVTHKKGSMITAQQGHQKVTRNSSFFKKSPEYPVESESESFCDDIFSEPGLDPNTHGTSIPDTNSDNQSPDIQDNIPIPVTMPVPVRRSSRITRAPKRLDDFVLYNFHA